MINSLVVINLAHDSEGCQEVVMEKKSRPERHPPSLVVRFAPQAQVEPYIWHESGMVRTKVRARGTVQEESRRASRLPPACHSL